MLMRLDLALITEVVGRMVVGEAAGSVGENLEDTELPRIITYRQQVQRYGLTVRV